MTYHDDDPSADIEALENQRHDADIEQAELVRASNRFARAERAGICTHHRSVGYRSPAIYPEQEGLSPGQSRCGAGCRRIFESDDDWHAAMADAVSGF